MPGAIAVLHKYVALATGAMLAAMGLSGALLVFARPLGDYFHPERLVQPAPHARPSYDAVLAAARGAVPGAQAFTLDVPEDPAHAFSVETGNPMPRHLFIDGFTGTVVSNHAKGELFLDWIELLHTHLLAGSTGEYVVGAFGTVLLVLIVSGIVQWWPRKWKHALRLRRGAVFAWDLHRASGAIAAIFLAISASTGLVLVFSGAATRLVNRAGGAQEAAEPQLAPQTQAPSRARLDAVVEAARRIMPGASVRRVVVSSGNAPILVRLQASGDHHRKGMERIYVNPYDATIVAAIPLSAAAPAVRMFDWLYPLHVGNLFGPLHQALLLLVGVTPALLFATGLLVWSAKRRARKGRGSGII